MPRSLRHDQFAEIVAIAGYDVLPRPGTGGKSGVTNGTEPCVETVSQSARTYDGILLALIFKYSPRHRLSREPLTMLRAGCAAATPGAQANTAGSPLLRPTKSV